MTNEEKVQQLPPVYASDAPPVPPPAVNPSYVQQHQYPQTGYVSANSAYVPPSQSQWSQPPTPHIPGPAAAQQDDTQDAASDDGYTTPGIPKEHLNVSFVLCITAILAIAAIS